MPRGRARVLALASAAMAVALFALWLASVEARARQAQQHLVAARVALTEGAAAGVLEGARSEGSLEPNAAITQLTSACGEVARADTLLRDLGGQVEPVKPVAPTIARFMAPDRSLKKMRRGVRSRSLPAGNAPPEGE